MSAHLNVKPLDRNQVHETENEAINHVLVHCVWSKGWKFDGAFGQTIAERRAIDAAIKAKDASAFRALRRRGYWRVELAS